MLREGAYLRDVYDRFGVLYSDGLCKMAAKSVNLQLDEADARRKKEPTHEPPASH